MVSAINERGEDISQIVRKNLISGREEIIRTLDLRSPIFQKTAAYGHFGRLGFPWEKIIEIVEKLKDEI